MAKIKTWGIRINDASRLPTAVRLLRWVETNGAYPSDVPSLVRIGNALTVAVDFGHIAAVLPSKPVPPIAEDIKRSLKGTLDDVTSTDALRAQSQLLFGAVLAAANLLPGAPDTAKPRKSPDYIIHFDGLPFGVEIGRPGSLKGGYAKIDDARSQVRAVGIRHHVMVLDISDMLRGIWDDARKAGSAFAIDGTFTDLNRNLGDYIARRPDPRIVLYGSIVRLFLWDLGASVRPVPVFKFHIEVFREAGAGLVQAQSEQLRLRIIEGWQALGAVATSLRRV